ncbi:DnaJ domain protein [Talaromyces proteolyticus]|uniref:DnaJ domain protein n=1 Tax=Talaromyces proteolyticus TaxID=1131652 RepID=A0AAD4Q203_9EURO|nr:DnaJ domain protein [Talaromyces proteolyticus]KAH8699224.1 DnaJ domain protein [Talaromyces proteolyticus]
MSNDEALGDPPASIDPYGVLDIKQTASADEVKSAYRKKALKHHPDKASPETRDEAKQKFQEIAFAYAILSDDRRRRRYDLTGNTSESLDLEDDDFDWAQFYQEQFSGMVDASAIDKIKKEYQGSDQEREDLLAAFEQFEGDLDRVYEVIMLSSVIDDDERFRAIIDKAIADEEVQAWKKYTAESESKRKKRLKHAQDEAAEAEEAAKELEERGAKGKGKNKKKKPSKEDDNALAALIQQRQKSRAANFFDDLEAKYAPKGKAKKRSSAEEPPEEAFAAVGARQTKGSARSKRAKT